MRRGGQVVLISSASLQTSLPPAAALKVLHSKSEKEFWYRFVPSQIVLIQPFLSFLLAHVGFDVVMNLVGRFNIHQKAKESWDVDLDKSN